MAALLYLCDDSHGGTGFYRHNATGWQRITAENRERYLDTYHEEVNRRRPPRALLRSFRRTVHLSRHAARPLQPPGGVPGSLLHSACIDPARSLSSDPRQGRLTVNTFYDF